MPYDKKLHLICGCIIALLIGLYNPICGLSAGVTAGAAKEVYGYYDYGKFDTKDMFFTWAGALIGTCLCFMVQI